MTPHKQEFFFGPRCHSCGGLYNLASGYCCFWTLRRCCAMAGWVCHPTGAAAGWLDCTILVLLAASRCQASALGLLHHHRVDAGLNRNASRTVLYGHLSYSFVFCCWVMGGAVRNALFCLKNNVNICQTCVCNLCHFVSFEAIFAGHFRSSWVVASQKRTQETDNGPKPSKMW